MIKRIVKMKFRQENIAVFEQMFNEHKDKIRSFDGCTHLELWQDKSDPRTFFTYSHWNTENSLDVYRKSELFRSVWSRTKALFKEKPEAWSVELIARGSEL
ncbi:MAG: antibiotic biosynthesis monooxygenase [Flavobacteriales bacterium]|nr:antibiotic biosynthesis monooxygenase [Flavobacteriales bacterium]NNK81415.1 antibiotic biosynthesis monooxygenase [Flavobacteriales bacterium]